jgi:hypothetical protein
LARIASLTALLMSSRSIVDILSRDVARITGRP